MIWLDYIVSGFYGSTLPTTTLIEEALLAPIFLNAVSIFCYDLENIDPGSGANLLTAPKVETTFLLLLKLDHLFNSLLSLV